MAESQIGSLLIFSGEILNSKERVYAALEGRPVDRFPVTSLYHMLYFQDHFAELTGRPQGENYAWRNTSPEEYLTIYQPIAEKVRFEILQPDGAPSREQRENISVVCEGDQYFYLDRRSGDKTPITSKTAHAAEYTANTTPQVRDLAEAKEKIHVTPVENMLAAGHNDYLDAVVDAMGNDNFIMCGGVAGTLWMCHFWMGLFELLEAMTLEPEVVDYINAKMLEQNIEHIRQMAASGGDAIYLDDAIATSDMISVKHFERWCLPSMIEMTKEVHRLGKKAILIYFGGVSDRIETIAEIGADGLSVEASNKGYINDITDYAKRVGDKITLFGNVDSVNVLQRGSDATLVKEMKKQADAGRLCKRFVHCTGSPITPSTPFQRVNDFVDLARHSRIDSRMNVSG